MMKDFVKFAKYNPLYLVCSAIYYVLASLLFGARWYSFLLAGVFYGVSLLVVFSPLGEKLLRMVEQVRPLEVQKEKESLFPIFNEVYEQAKQKNPELGHIEMCLIEKMEINACAIGKHTVAVTKGAIETFGEDELKALIAHEIAHIAHGDTTASLYTWVGNGIFTVFILMTRGLVFLIDFIMALATGSGFARIVLICSKFSFELSIMALMFLMQIVISINSRKNEFRADQYAFELGYGEELVEAFYTLDKINMGGERKLTKKMTASHPRLTVRIGKLEELLDGQGALPDCPLAP